jgi:hypothetical protein
LTGIRAVVLARAPEDEALSAEVAAQLLGLGVQAWPTGPEIEADYASGELIRHLIAADALVAITTPALLEWSFVIREARLSRALGRPVVAAVWPFASGSLPRWLLDVEPVVTLTCAGAANAAAQVADTVLPPTDTASEAVHLAAARLALIEVGAHGGTVGAAAAHAGVETSVLHVAAFHLRAIGVIDWSPPLDEATTLAVIG